MPMCDLDPPRQRFRVTYAVDDGVTFTWTCKAYDRDHAIEKFCADGMFEYEDIVKVERIKERA